MNPATQMPRILRHNAGQWETLEKDIFIEALASISIEQLQGWQCTCSVTSNPKPKTAEKIKPETNLSVCLLEKPGDSLISHECFDQLIVYIRPERILNKDRIF